VIYLFQVHKRET